MLDRPTEGGGEGPPALLGPGGKPPFIGPFAPPEYGGEASWPCSNIGFEPGGPDFGYGPSFSIPVGQMVPEVDTGDNGGLARAASIVCTAETGRRCQGAGAGGQSNDYASSVVDAGTNKGFALARRQSFVEALNPAVAGQGLMFARGGTHSVEESWSDRWTDQERLDVGLDRTHTPPSVPGSALQKSTGRFVTCVKGIRDV